MAKVNLKNSVGVVKVQKVGFSWTTLFFGGLVALFRGNFIEVLKWLFLNPVTFGIWGLIQCWTANKKEVISLLEKGYVPATDADRVLLQSRKVVGGN